MGGAPQRLSYQLIDWLGEPGMRLNGWMRIAIVASIAWMVGATIYEGEKEMASLYALRASVMKTQADCVVRSYQQDAGKRPQETCQTSEQAFEQQMSLQPRSIQWLAFRPAIWLFFAWLLGGIALLAIWWIRRGFRPRVSS